MKSIVKNLLGPSAWSRLRAIYILLRDRHEVHWNAPVLTYAYPGYLSDARFIEAYARAQQITGFVRDIRWRAHTFCVIARHCLSVPGDFVECGTRTGLMTHTMLQYASFGTQNRTLYLFDTWAGFDRDSLGENEKHLADTSTLKVDFEKIRDTYTGYSNVTLVRGAVPGTLEQVTWGKVAFVHIDMNCRAPEIAAMEFFWDKLSSGGAIVLDDYGHPGYDDQRLAHDAFARAKGVAVMALPTGTGIIFKP
jgi:hypothetical protein